MSDWTLKLCVAIIAASGVIVSALIGLWKDRKSRREILLQDLAILEKLPCPSLVHISLAHYVDKRALFLSVEDKIGLYIFSGGVLIIVIIILTITIVLGITTKHLIWPFAAAAVALTMAIVAVVYRYSVVKLTDWLKNRIETSSRATAINLVRDSVAESIHNEVLEDLYSKFPEPYRKTVKDRLGSATDIQIAEMVERGVDSFLSGNRYSDWSPDPKSAPTGSKLELPIKLRLLLAILKVFNVLAQWAGKGNKDAPPPIVEAEEPSQAAR
ncbi:hypothetical protein [Mycobacterium triplex]|uniref:Transmembrane protein n=1 Tax=Mycobacterium triplex TaxID=47839 RepID=A0A024JPE2_9MYCO|nr:hypothetical protein [Mycobacterium triplex]CDO85700.1 hypothetical protein BN973_00031 [Mycobacterium triplex]